MKLYILTAEPYHDGTLILGIFSTLEKAISSGGGDFSEECAWGGAILGKKNPGRFPYYEYFYIEERELDVAGDFDAAWSA